MNIKQVKKAIISLLVYIIASSLLSRCAASIVLFLDKNNKILINALFSISGILAVLIIVLLSKDELKGLLKNFLSNFKDYIGFILKTWLKGFGLMILANIVINIIIMGGIAPNEEANREILNLYPFYSILSICVLAPIAEEILFRLNFKGMFNNKKYAIVASGLLFGLMHVLSVDISLANFIYIVPYAILGVIFAKIYFDTDCIYTSMTAHALHNMLSVLVIILGA